MKNQKSGSTAILQNGKQSQEKSNNASMQSSDEIV